MDDSAVKEDHEGKLMLLLNDYGRAEEERLAERVAERLAEEGSSGPVEGDRTGCR